MYEQYFANFELVDKDSPLCVVRLIEPVFQDIEVLIATQFQVVDVNGHQEIVFDYDTIKVPDGFDKDLLLVPEYIDLVRNIFMALLEKKLNEGPILVETNG